MDQTQIKPLIISITKLRRRLGYYLDKNVPFIIIKDSEVAGFFIPINPNDKDNKEHDAILKYLRSFVE